MGDATADTEPDIIAHTKNLRSDVLKVAHHGSKYSTSEEFLIRSNQNGQSSAVPKTTTMVFLAQGSWTWCGAHIQRYSAQMNREALSRRATAAPYGGTPHLPAHGKQGKAPSPPKKRHTPAPQKQIQKREQTPQPQRINPYRQKMLHMLLM